MIVFLTTLHYDINSIGGIVVVALSTIIAAIRLQLQLHHCIRSSNLIEICFSANISKLGTLAENFIFGFTFELRTMNSQFFVFCRPVAVFVFLGILYRNFVLPKKYCRSSTTSANSR